MCEAELSPVFEEEVTVVVTVAVFDCCIVVFEELEEFTVFCDADPLSVIAISSAEETVTPKEYTTTNVLKKTTFRIIYFWGRNKLWARVRQGCSRYFVFAFENFRAAKMISASGSARISHARLIVIVLPSILLPLTKLSPA